MHDTTTPDPLLTEKGAAELLRVSPITLARWRKDGQAPRHILIHGAHIRYRLADVEAWLVAQQGGEA